MKLAVDVAVLLKKFPQVSAEGIPNQGHSPNPRVIRLGRRLQQRKPLDIVVPESWLQSAGHSNTGDPDQNDFSENVTLIRQIRPDLTRSWVSFCSNSNLSIRRCPISPQVPALRKCNFSFISEMKMLVCSEIFIEYFPCE